MLFKLALHNLRMQWKNYLSYYASSSFSVFALYLFLSVYCSSSVRNALGDMKSIMVLFVLSVGLIAFFSAFFIWYANSFFIRSRKKEFATYMLLGMSKRQTVSLNFVENLAVLALAFGTGVAAGILLDKLLVMALLYAMHSGGNVSFEISVQALRVCSFIYLAVFALISLHSAILLYKNSLLNLLNAAKHAERGLKVSALTVLIAVLSVLILGLAYYIAAYQMISGLLLLYIPLVVMLVCLGTFLLFTGLASIVLYCCKKSESSLFRGTRLITVSQLFFRFRGNVGTLSVIAITTSVAFTAVLFCCGMYSHEEQNSRLMQPYSVEYYDTGRANGIFADTLQKHKEIQVKSQVTLELAPVTAGSNSFTLISESAYDHANAVIGTGLKANLKNDGEALMIQSLETPSVIGKTFEITAGNMHAPVKIVKLTTHYEIALNHFQQTLVVKDRVYSRLKSGVNPAQLAVIHGVMLKNDWNARSFAADLSKNMPAQARLLDFYDYFMQSLKLYGMLFFIGIFIGLMFLIATGSIIQFRMAMEAAEDRDKFVSLRRIGADRKEIRSAVVKELAVVFGAPFLIAVLNAYVAKIPLEKMIHLNISDSFLTIVLVYAALYGIYYLATLRSYVRTVCE